MVKRQHRPHVRHDLEFADGRKFWVNVFEDGEIRVAAYDTRLIVTEVMTRGPGESGRGGAHVTIKSSPQ